MLAYVPTTKMGLSTIRYFRKLLAATFSCSHAGMKALFLRLFALPVAMSLMWVFYSNVGDDAKGFYSKSAMILNILGLAYGAGVWVTLSLCMCTFFHASFRHIACRI